MPFTLMEDTPPANGGGNIEWGAKRFGNVPTGSIEGLISTLYNAPKLLGIDLEREPQRGYYGRTGMPEAPETARQHIPRPFEIEQGNLIGELLPSLLEQIPSYMAGGAAARAAIGAGGVGTVLGRTAIGAGEFAGGALGRDPDEVPIEAGLGGVYGLAGTQDWRIRLAAGLLAGGGSAINAYREGAEPLQTVLAGVGGVAQPFMMGKNLRGEAWPRFRKKSPLGPKPTRVEGDFSLDATLQDPTPRAPDLELSNPEYDPQMDLPLEPGAAPQIPHNELAFETGVYTRAGEPRTRSMMAEAPAGSLVRDPSMSVDDLMEMLQSRRTPPPGSLIRHPRFGPEEAAAIRELSFRRSGPLSEGPLFSEQEALDRALFTANRQAPAPRPARPISTEGLGRRTTPPEGSLVQLYPGIPTEGIGRRTMTQPPPGHRPVRLIEPEPVAALQPEVAPPAGEPAPGVQHGEHAQPGYTATDQPPVATVQPKVEVDDIGRPLSPEHQAWNEWARIQYGEGSKVRRIQNGDLIEDDSMTGLHMQGARVVAKVLSPAVFNAEGKMVRKARIITNKDPFANSFKGDEPWSMPPDPTPLVETAPPSAKAPVPTMETQSQPLPKVHVPEMAAAPAVTAAEPPVATVQSAPQPASPKIPVPESLSGVKVGDTLINEKGVPTVVESLQHDGTTISGQETFSLVTKTPDGQRRRVGDTTLADRLASGEMKHKPAEPAGTTAASKSKKLTLNTVITEENFQQAAEQLGLQDAFATGGPIPSMSAVDPAHTGGVGVKLGQTLRDLRNAQYWSRRMAEAYKEGGDEAVAAVRAERDKVRGKAPKPPKAPSQPVTADTTPPVAAKIEPVVTLTDPAPTEKFTPLQLASAIESQEKKLWDMRNGKAGRVTKRGIEQNEAWLQELKDRYNESLPDHVKIREGLMPAEPAPVAPLQPETPTGKISPTAEKHISAIEDWVLNDDKPATMRAIKKAHKEGLISDNALSEAKRIAKDRDMGPQDIVDGSGVLDDLNNPELIKLQKAEPVAPLQDKTAAPPTTSTPSPLENPLARRDQPGYIPTVDAISRATEMVGDVEFNRLAEERIVQTGAASEGTRAIAIERAARKILAKDMVLKGERLDVPEGHRLMEEIIAETGTGPEAEIAALQVAGRRTASKPEKFQLRKGSDTDPAGTQTAPRITEGVKEKVEGITFKGTGGGKMKLSNFGEHGYIVNEAMFLIARNLAMPAVGASIGYATADEHKLASAAMGALAMGYATHRFAKALRYLAKQHPEVQAEGSYANRMYKMASAIKVDLIEGGKGLAADYTKAARADSQRHLASASDKVAHWMRKDVTMNEDVTNVFQRAMGRVQEHAEIFDFALRQLELAREFIDPHNRWILKQYFSGKMGHHEFTYHMKSAEVVKWASAATSSRKILSQAIKDSFGDNKSKLVAEIERNLDSYLTRTFEAFHNPKWNPSAAKIEAAAQALGKAWGSIEIRRDKVAAYVSEIMKNRGLYNELTGPRIAHDKTGESLHSVLTQKEVLSPEFVELLGKYEDPVQEMAATAIKLVNGARSAEYLNLLSTSKTSHGLKFAYTGEERLAEMGRLEGLIRTSADESVRSKAVATLQQLEGYSTLFQDDAFGKLSGMYLKPEARDKLANYQRSLEMFRSPLARNLVNATNLIKYGKTVLSPLQLVRQLYTFPILGLLARTYPSDWAAATKVMLSKSPEAVEARLRMKRLGVIGGDFTAGELRRDTRALREGKVGKLFEKTRLGKILHGWEEIYRTPDIINRVAAFMMKEKELTIEYGKSPEAQLRIENEAINYTNRYTMNYAAVPNAVVYGRQLPFINQYLTFAWEMTRITKNLMQDAKRGDTHAIVSLGLMATVPFLLQGLTEHMLSDKDQEEWTKTKAMMPSYSRHNFKFVTGREANGDFRYYDFTPIIPHEPWLRMLRALGEGDASALMATNPLLDWENTPSLNVATSMVSGRDRRTGEPFTGPWDMVHNIRKEVAPTLFGGTEMDRIIRALTPNDQGTLGTYNIATGAKNSITDVLLTHLLSTRPYSIRPGILQQRTIAEARELTTIELSRLRRTMQSDAAPFIKESARERYQSNIKQIYSNLQWKLGVKNPDLQEVEP